MSYQISDAEVLRVAFGIWLQQCAPEIAPPIAWNWLNFSPGTAITDSANVRIRVRQAACGHYWFLIKRGPNTARLLRMCHEVTSINYLVVDDCDLPNEALYAELTTRWKTAYLEAVRARSPHKYRAKKLAFRGFAVNMLRWCVDFGFQAPTPTQAEEDRLLAKEAFFKLQ